MMPDFPAMAVLTALIMMRREAPDQLSNQTQANMGPARKRGKFIPASSSLDGQHHAGKNTRIDNEMSS